MEKPPPFQEATRCDVCKSGFNTFRRRHHCRRCGRTLCNEHSSDQIALPQFGIYTPVRVCADCFNGSSRKTDISAFPSVSNAVVDGVSTLSIGDEDVQMKNDSTTESRLVSSVVECKCGMPLCICEAPAPAPTPAPSADAPPMPKKPSSTSVSQSNPRPKKTESLRNRGSTSNSKPSSVFNRGQVYNGTVDNSQMDYEVNGEGVREAIKNSDAAAVKKLLSQGVDANYRDKQGSSLLHLAAVFNQTDIAFALMDCGANLNYRNAQGETPLDCAPVTLQYKMREKIREDEDSGQQ